MTQVCLSPEAHAAGRVLPGHRLGSGGSQEFPQCCSLLGGPGPQLWEESHQGSLLSSSRLSLSKLSWGLSTSLSREGTAAVAVTPGPSTGQELQLWSAKLHEKLQHGVCLLTPSSPPGYRENGSQVTIPTSISCNLGQELPAGRRGLEDICPCVALAERSWGPSAVWGQGEWWVGGRKRPNEGNVCPLRATCCVSAHRLGASPQTLQAHCYFY